MKREIAELFLTGEDVALFPGYSYVDAVLPARSGPLDPDRVYPDREYPRWVPAIADSSPATVRKVRVLVEGEGDDRCTVITLSVQPPRHDPLVVPLVIVQRYVSLPAQLKIQLSDIAEMELGSWLGRTRAARAGSTSLNELRPS